MGFFSIQEFLFGLSAHLWLWLLASRSLDGMKKRLSFNMYHSLRSTYHSISSVRREASTYPYCPLSPKKYAYLPPPPLLEFTFVQKINHDQSPQGTKRNRHNTRRFYLLRHRGKKPTRFLEKFSFSLITKNTLRISLENPPDPRSNTLVFWGQFHIIYRPRSFKGTSK